MPTSDDVKKSTIPMHTTHKKKPLSFRMPFASTSHRSAASPRANTQTSTKTTQRSRSREALPHRLLWRCTTRHDTTRHYTTLRYLPTSRPYGYAPQQRDELGSRSCLERTHVQYTRFRTATTPPLLPPTISLTPAPFKLLLLRPRPHEGRGLQSGHLGAWEDRALSTT